MSVDGDLRHGLQPTKDVPTNVAARQRDVGAFGASDKPNRDWIPHGHTSQSEVDDCGGEDDVLLFTLRVVNVGFPELVPNLEYLPRVGRNYTEVRGLDSSRCRQGGNEIKHVLDIPCNSLGLGCIALGRSTRLLRVLASDIDINPSS
jgi:hypothetical protein